MAPRISEPNPMAKKTSNRRGRQHASLGKTGVKKIAKSVAPPTSAPPRWFDLDTLAELCSLTKMGFHTAVRPRISDDDIRKVGKRSVIIRGAAAIQALVDLRVQQATPENGDPLLTGGTSANLERYRKEKADSAAMDNAERRGLIIPAAKIQPFFNEFSSGIRRACEAIIRQHGPESIDPIREAIAESRRRMVKLFPAPKDGAKDAPKENE